MLHSPSACCSTIFPPKKPQSESQESKHAEPKKIVRLEVYPMDQSTLFMENHCGKVGKEDAKKVRVCADNIAEAKTTATLAQICTVGIQP